MVSNNVYRHTILLPATNSSRTGTFLTAHKKPKLITFYGPVVGSWYLVVPQLRTVTQQEATSNNITNDPEAPSFATTEYLVSYLIEL